MCLKVLTPTRLGGWIEARTVVRVMDERRLSCSAGHGESLRPSIVVYADLADDTLDPVAVPNGLAQSLEDYTGYALPARVAVGLLNSPSQWLHARKTHVLRGEDLYLDVPHSRLSGGRKHTQLALGDVGKCRQQQISTAGHGDGGYTTAEGLHCFM